VLGGGEGKGRSSCCGDCWEEVSEERSAVLGGKGEGGGFKFFNSVGEGGGVLLSSIGGETFGGLRG